MPVVDDEDVEMDDEREREGDKDEKRLTKCEIIINSSDDYDGLKCSSS